jgi:hypothetical protein
MLRRLLAARHPNRCGVSRGKPDNASAKPPFNLQFFNLQFNGAPIARGYLTIVQIPFAME